MSKTPNIFTHAPSELAQDAFFCWLLEWADEQYKKEDPALHKVAQDFIHMLCKEAGKSLSFISTVKVETQHTEAKIDIFCTINKGKGEEESYLVIEDKVWAMEHNEQLQRAIEEMTAKDKVDKCCFIYLQTGDSPKSYLTEIEKERENTKAKYKVIGREDVLRILNTYKPQGIQQSDIIVNFREHLSKTDERMKVHKSQPIDQWKSKEDKTKEGDAWIGFYKELADKLDDKDTWWGYVHNSSGGFMGFAWHTKYIKDIKNIKKLTEDELKNCEKIYLQIESSRKRRLCVKVAMGDKESSLKEERKEGRKKTQDYIGKRLMGGIKNEYLEQKYLRTGKTMTVAHYKNAFPVQKDDGKVDVEKTLSVMRQMEKLLDDALKNLESGK